MVGTDAFEQPKNLFSLDELDDNSRAKMVANGDLGTLRMVAHWIRTFVAGPHKDLGRPGPVCPFVPAARDRRTLWLAIEPIAGRSAQDLVQLIRGYTKLFLNTQPVHGDDAALKSFVIVFTDLSADRAKAFFDEVLQHLAVPTYAADGLVLGAFYARNEGAAIHNPGFRPFTPPVPFLLMRPAVISDWKFFLDNEQWLTLWARRYRETAVHALADELRRLPWRTSSSALQTNPAAILPS